MARFRFQAVDAVNERHDGVIEAASEEEVARLLTRQGLFAVRIGAEKTSASLWALLNKDISFGRPLAPRELVSLAQEWAGLLSAGIALNDALALSETSARRAAARKLVGRIAERVRRGGTFRDALDAEGIFPASFVALVGAGEAAGELGPAMVRIADDLERARDFAERLGGSLIYPACLTVAATGAIVVLLVVVVPNLQALIGAEGVEGLPVATRTVIAASDLVRTHGVAIGAGLLALVLAAALAWRLPASRSAVDRLLLKVPVFGRILTGIDLGRYCRSLSALLAGGVSLARALPLARRTVANRAMNGDFARAERRVLDGAVFAEALADGGLVPPEVLVLIRTGEGTGRLAEAAGNAASMLEKRVRRRLETITTVVGPALTVTFGLVAGLIIYAMLSAILQINDVAFQ
jgi:general secretion pathway protein F